MKSFLIFVSAIVCIGLVASHMHIPQSCYHCMAGKLEDCASNQMMMMNCSNATFPNVGSGDCYTAVGWYMVNNMWHSTALRGCVDCSDENAAKDKIKMDFDALPQNWELNVMYFRIMCCNSTGCNNMDVTLPSSPTASSPTRSSTEASTGSNTATTFLSIGGIFAMLLPVSGWLLN